MDLLAISNISVVIFDYGVHCYYLHGQNKNGSSEGTIEYLKENLEKEAKCFLNNWGLLSDFNSDLQSFEIFLSSNVIELINKMYFLEIKNQINKIQNFNYLNNQNDRN